MGWETSARHSQARALGWKEMGSAGEGLRADRARALLCVAYETLARRGELVALEVRDIEFWPNGIGQALIRRGKSDAEGQGRVTDLSRRDGEMAKDLARGCGYSRRADISALDRQRSNWRGERTLYAGRSRPRPSAARH